MNMIIGKNSISYSLDNQQSGRNVFNHSNSERLFTIAVAGHIFAIHAKFDRIYSLCNQYLCRSIPEYHINVTEKDLDYERERERIDNVSLNYSELEALSVLRKVSEILLSFDTLLMHGAVVAVNEEAFMFTADSGVGKTTHIKKWLDHLENAYVVNGDKPFIHIADNRAIACGSPWCGKEQLGTNTKVPLKAIVLMERGESNAIEEITFKDAYVLLLEQTYRPSNPPKLLKTIELLSRLDGKVRLFRYIFNNFKEDAFSVSYQVETAV